MLHRLVQKARSRRRTPATYDPGIYWEARADELVEVYDRPETWRDRGWMAAGAEEETVPRLLAEAGAHTVVVAGAGSGRQYDYLLAHGLEPSGFDISPTLVETCRTRYSQVETHVGSVTDAARHGTAADAALSAAVLQHVRPGEIESAVASLKSLAQKIVVIRELTELATSSTYQFVHDYDALFADWREVHREVTDRREGVTVELIAWVPS